MRDDESVRRGEAVEEGRLVAKDGGGDAGDDRHIGGIGDRARAVHQSHLVGVGTLPLGDRVRGGLVVATGDAAEVRDSGRALDAERQQAGAEHRRVEHLRAGVDVGGVEQMENEQEGPHSAVVGVHLLDRGARGGVDELHPAVFAAVEDADGAEGRADATIVEPGEDILKMGVDGHRPRFVDQLRARGEAEEHDGVTAAVGVAQSRIDP